MSDDVLDELVHRGDLDGLIRLVDSRTSNRDWDGLRRARDGARHAVTTGRQLWPVATLAEYRLALWAPAEWAALMIDDSMGRFTIGPLTEVVAQRHTWDELRPYLPAGPGAAIVAHERALRGEAIAPDSLTGLPLVIDLDPIPAAWEPPYPLATYSDDGVDAPMPPLPRSSVRTSPPRPAGEIERIDDIGTELAVRQLVEPWTASSDGRAEVTCVEGTAHDAVTALGVGHRSLERIPVADAVALMAWAGASGGAHGRRRGASAGRFGALWTVATVLDLVDDWPVPGRSLGEQAAELEWCWWDAGEPVTGWRLQLAVEDHADGLAWAISARDSA